MEIQFLKNKVALITGGTGGIGKILCSTMAEAGCNVAIHYHKNESEAKKLASSLIDKYRVFAITVQADVSDESQVLLMFENILKEFSKIDILVNNCAERGNPFNVVDMPLSDWKRVIDVNLTGTFLCTKYALKSMREQKWGRIINITSIVGETGSMQMSAYSSSKAGITSFTKSVAKEEGKYGITVNAIAPGPIKISEGSFSDEFKKARDEFHKKVLPFIPLGRIGSPEDIANLVLFLSSDKAQYITGQEIKVDGGLGRF